MADVVISPNMNLPIPIIGVDPGPQYATDSNSCLNLIDQHDHSVGYGVPITPNGMNISADLTFNSNSATNLLKAAFTSQSVALTGTNFISFVSGNFYVNDESGNQIQITSSGGVAGSPGSIANLVSPASATYTAGSKTFTWSSGVSKAGAMDNGAITIRETNVASAKGITLASPTSLGSDYGLTLPTGLPVSGTQYVSLDSSGNLGSVTADSIASAISATGANAIGVSMTSTGANAVAASATRLTGTSVPQGGIAISASCGNSYSNNTGTFTDVTNLSVTLTTSGRPIFMGLMSDGSGQSCGFGFVGGTNQLGTFRFTVGSGTLLTLLQSDVTNAQNFFQGVFQQIYVVGAGTYIFKVQAQRGNATSVAAAWLKFFAYEL